jgi:hypothetical protein
MNNSTEPNWFDREVVPYNFVYASLSGWKPAEGYENKWCESNHQRRDFKKDGRGDVDACAKHI